MTSPSAALGELLRIKHGFAFKGEFFEAVGDELVLTPGNFKIGGGLQIRPGKERYYSGPYPSAFALQPGDLLIAMTDLTQGAPILGSPIEIPTSGRYLHNQRLGKVIDLDATRLDRKYAYYTFVWDGVRAQLRASATGSTVRHTAPERIYRVVVPIPPLPTQRKVVAILSAYDHLFDANNRRIRILEEIAQRIYREWFVDFRYPGHEVGSTMDSKIGRIPAGWTIESFADLGDYVNGYAFKPADWGHIGRPIVKIRELKASVTSDTPRYAGNLPDKFDVRDGDLLFSWSADLDAYLWTGGRAWLNQHVFRVDPHPGIQRSWLYHSLRERMPEFRARAQGTTMRHIKRAALAQVNVVKPVPAAIDQFAAFVEPIDNLVLNLVTATRALREARDLLLPCLISGELDVESLDIDLCEVAA